MTRRCAGARAAARGVYSRFHQGGTPAGEAEAALYASTAGQLAGHGYPIQIVPISDQTAAQVADAVAGLVRDRITTAGTQ